MKDLKKLQSEQQKVQREIEQLQNRQKILLNRKTDTERRARTRRLIEHGAILESIFPATVTMTGEEVKAFLLALSRLPGALRPLDAMGSYTPQTPCAPGKTEHPLRVYSVFPGLYPATVNTPKGGKTA